MEFWEKLKRAWKAFLAQNEEDAKHLHEDGRLDCCTMNRQTGPQKPK